MCLILVKLIGIIVKARFIQKGKINTSFCDKDIVVAIIY